MSEKKWKQIGKMIVRGKAVKGTVGDLKFFCMVSDVEDLLYHNRAYVNLFLQEESSSK